MFTVNLIVADNVLAANPGLTRQMLDTVIEGIEMAAELWSRYIDGNNAIIDISLDFSDLPGSTLAEAGARFFSQNGGPFQSEVTTELNGQTGVLAQDGSFTIDLPRLLSGGFFFTDSLDFVLNPSPGQIDFLTLAAHELGHVLGFTELAFGDLAVRNTFIGENAVAANGGNAVQLADGVHILGNDLLSPSISNNLRESINEIHIAILEDIGVPIAEATNAADTLYGFNQSDDNLNGLAGNDALFGLEGNDILNGGLGDDIINGGTGADTIDGGTGGTDTVTFVSAAAGVRVDLIVGGQTGDAAGDTYTNINDIDGSSFDDVLLGDDNSNEIFGSAGNDRLLGRGGDDILLGGVGNDTLLGGAGADVLNGGTGVDTVSYFSSLGGVEASLFSNAGNDLGDAIGDVFINIENLEGSNDAASGAFDILIGNNDANTIFGFAGNDQLLGLGGNDRLFGGTGNDSIEGGLGADLLNGGAGIDTASYQTASTDIRADLFFFGQNQGEAAGDIYGAIENLTGSDNNDVLLGNGGVNVLTGLDGNDRLFGRGGADTLEGGLGADRLGGGFGGVTASDGAADTFVLVDITHSTLSALGRDTIIDFWRADGDRVDLSQIDANTMTSADDAFTFIGNVGFSSEAGQLRYAAPINQIQGDVNGDGIADFAIQVDNVANMIASDFIL